MTTAELLNKERESNIRLIVIPIVIVGVMAVFYYKVFNKWKNYLKVEGLEYLLLQH